MSGCSGPERHLAELEGPLQVGPAATGSRRATRRRRRSSGGSRPRPAAGRRTGRRCYGPRRPSRSSTVTCLSPRVLLGRGLGQQVVRRRSLTACASRRLDSARRFCSGDVALGRDGAIPRPRAAVFGLASPRMASRVLTIDASDQERGERRRRQRTAPGACGRISAPGRPADGGPASTGSSARYRWTSRGQGVGRLVPPRRGPSPGPSSRSSRARPRTSFASLAGSVLPSGRDRRQRLARFGQPRAGPGRLLLADHAAGSRRKRASRSRSPLERGASRSAARRAARPASRCRSGCRCPAPLSSACSGLMYSGVPTTVPNWVKSGPLGRAAGRSPWRRRSR